MDITKKVLNRLALRIGTEVVEREIAEAERDAAAAELKALREAWTVAHPDGKD